MNENEALCVYVAAKLSSTCWLLKQVHVPDRIQTGQCASFLEEDVRF